jgi:hypothetical protein
MPSLRKFPYLLLVGLALSTINAQTSAGSPVGGWLSDQISNGGIGSWWNFRPDGTLSMSIGAAVTSHVTHTATTVTMPPPTVNGAPLTLNYKVEGSTLTLTKAGDPDTRFTRVGAPPVPSDPLLGRWRPNPPSTPSQNRTIAQYQQAMANGLTIFSPDNTESVRIPFTTHTGTWNAPTHTFKLEGDPNTYTFSRSGKKLTLVGPTGAKDTHTYSPDPVFP